MTAHKSKYFLHDEDVWNRADRQEIDEYFTRLGFASSQDAAIGEGAGGPGWETVIEVILYVSGVAGLGEQIWKLSKFLRKKKPVIKAPGGQSEIYKLVVHIDTTIISINLLENENNIKEAARKLDNINLNVSPRLYQNKDSWDKF